MTITSSRSVPRQLGSSNISMGAIPGLDSNPLCPQDRNMPIPPPRDISALMQRATDLAGCTLGELATTASTTVPDDLRRHKGWVGQLLECLLGAEAGSLAEPDFPALGIELKTLPLDHHGRPRESTYICTVPLEECANRSWERSWVRRKLAHVLWFPVEADSALPLAVRRVGQPLLWKPDVGEEALLRTDWEELMDMVCMGELEQISARIGEVMQIRPKAANARIMGRATGADGAPIQTNLRGFYLRPAFTAVLLERHYHTTYYQDKRDY